MCMRGLPCHGAKCSIRRARRLNVPKEATRSAATWSQHSCGETHSGCRHSKKASSTSARTVTRKNSTAIMCLFYHVYNLFTPLKSTAQMLAFAFYLFYFSPDLFFDLGPLPALGLQCFARVCPASCRFPVCHWTQRHLHIWRLALHGP